jgi:hypothetical protein
MSKTGKEFFKELAALPPKKEDTKATLDGEIEGAVKYFIDTRSYPSLHERSLLLAASFNREVKARLLTVEQEMVLRELVEAIKLRYAELTKPHASQSVLAGVFNDSEEEGDIFEP